MADTKRRPFAIYEFSPSMTKQSFKEEVDINEIMKRAQNGMDISSQVRERIAQYGDFTQIGSYQEALNTVKRAQDAFYVLDANVRERFMNDPGRMISFLQDPANYDEAVKLGLVVPKPPQEASVSDVKTKASSDAKSTKAKRTDDEA